ncbi:hypothetical protein KC644_04010 [Candidatus Berkelbacteria bacterium]|nr:hypothetical protein [Candidatus Berkelbacteria bacterium]
MRDKKIVIRLLEVEQSIHDFDSIEVKERLGFDRVGRILNNLRKEYEQLNAQLNNAS